MAAGTLQDILAAQNLIGMIQAVVGGVPSNLLPPAFYNATRGCEGEYGTYWKVRGTRQTARRVDYNSPSKNRELAGVSKVQVNLIHTKENTVFEPNLLQNLLAEDQRDPNTEVKQKNGLQTIARQTADFGSLFKNLRVSAIYSALAKGAVYFDAAGNLLDSSSNALNTIDYGVPAGNKTQCNVLGAGNIIDVSWDDPTADILGQLQNLINAVVKLNGYELTHAFYGAKVPGLLANNAAFSYIIRGDQASASATRTVTIPGGTGGIANWVPVSQAFYAKASSTSVTALGADETSMATSWFGDTQIVFTPDPSPDWWEILEGSYLVPRAFTVEKDAMQMVNNLMATTGPFSYAVMVDDPVSIKQIAGDTFLPVIKVPGAVVNATVVF